MSISSLSNATPVDVNVNGGLHILSNFETHELKLMEQFEHFRQYITDAVSDAALKQVGEAWHNFEGGGFTGVLCLAESHLSIHTWPADHYVTFDIYLSNHAQDNSHKARLIYDQVITFFHATVLMENSIQR